MKNLAFLFLAIALAIITFSCVSSVGEESTIEKSGKTPEWLNTPTFKDNSNIYVIGEMSKCKDRAFGLNQAYADGLRKLMNMMINDAKTQSAQVLKGSNVDEGDVEKYSEFAVAWISQTYTIGNVENLESYWEKIRVITSSGETYYYNCYTKLKISKHDFNMALVGAFANMKKKAKEGNNKTVEDIADKLIKDLENEK